MTICYRVVGRNISLQQKDVMKNRIVENAGVAFVKGAPERNEYFVKINSNVLQASTDEQGKGLTISGTN